MDRKATEDTLWIRKRFRNDRYFGEFPLVLPVLAQRRGSP